MSDSSNPEPASDEPAKERFNEQRCKHGKTGPHFIEGSYPPMPCRFNPGPSVVTPPAPTFDAMLRDPSEQFDRNSELLPGILSYLSGQERTEEVERLLRSVEAYRNAPSNTLSAPPYAVTPPAQDEQRQTGWDYDEHPGDCHARRIEAVK